MNELPEDSPGIGEPPKMPTIAFFEELTPMTKEDFDRLLNYFKQRRLQNEAK